MSREIAIDQISAVWNQSQGVVQLFVNDGTILYLPQAKARELAELLEMAARTPDLARNMAVALPASDEILVNVMDMDPAEVQRRNEEYYLHGHGLRSSWAEGQSVDDMSRSCIAG